MCSTIVNKAIVKADSTFRYNTKAPKSTTTQDTLSQNKLRQTDREN